ncbi:hypothetical protein TRFO_19784 [Tritrichomonas foetus]|uniref:Uncharacterized protein n=1 Tax=Tritrichomonas foetus TaxID=1144522 RepID=A0A1J4KN46_9EUKA|nr:hypothetical protein TRFO_19784 [Tritrichomonas foetus]|eukprot:OHT10813.1 hypothetical protein TRFO_19784 [Tritrichomonas foetus]
MKLIIKKMIEFLALSGIFFYIYLLYSILQKLLHFLSARTQKQLPNHLNLIRTNFDFDEPEQPFSQQTQTITKYNQKKKKYKEAQEKKSREGVISRYKTKHKENMKIIQCLQQKKRQKDTLLIEEMLNQFLSQPVSHAIANNFKNFVYRKKNVYDIESRLFWIELYCNLKTTQYTYVSNLLNGPCTLTINSWIKTENIPCFCDFSQINKITNIIRYFTDILQDKVELPEELYVNISVDATHVEQCFHRKKKEIYGVLDSGKKIISKYDPFYSNDCLLYRKMMAELIENNSFINNIFIFMINPFFTVSSFPVFVYTSNNGSADQNILNSLQNISKEISSPFRVIMHSYDADPSYDSAQTKYFEKWTKYFKKSSELLSIKDCVMTPNDPAHILKRIRKHLIKYGAVFLKNYNSKEAISKNTFYQYDTIGCPVM